MQTTLSRLIDHGSMEEIQVFFNRQHVGLKPKLRFALKHAIYHRRADVIVYFCESNPEILEEIDERGCTFMHYCIQVDTSIEIIILLVRYAPFLLTRPNLMGLTPLHAACMYKHQSVIDKLVYVGTPLSHTTCTRYGDAMTTSIRNQRVQHIETLVRLGYRGLHLWNTTAWSQTQELSTETYHRLVALTTNIDVNPRHDQPTDEQCTTIRDRVHFTELSSHRLFLRILFRKNHRFARALVKRRILL